MKVAIVTGGASGIGRATAHRLASDVDVLALFDINAEKLEYAKLDLTSAFPGIIVTTSICNAMELESVLKAVKSIGSAYGQIDILVNCAGGSDYFDGASSKRPEDLQTDTMPAEYWNMVITLNLSGTFHMTKAVLPILKEQHSGSIVNVTSIAGRTGNTLAGAAYSSAKAGIIGFTRHVATEYASCGIRCNAVAPGMVSTERFVERKDTPAFKNMVAQIPFGRLSEPEEQANAIAFLALPASSYITGAVLDVNGGWFMG